MLNLQSFVHRAALADVFRRWMVNRPERDDVERLKRIVNFNSYIARIWVDHLVRALLSDLHGGVAIHSFVAKTKGQLKDFLVDNLSYTNGRIEQLVAGYRARPEDYFRETPFDGRVYYASEGGVRPFLASTRVKRFRRIAEKGSRRIIDFLVDRIRRNADVLADERAHRLGIPKAMLLTPEAEMAAEFAAAEERVVRSIRAGSIQSELPVLPIPDVVGIKLAAEEGEIRKVLTRLAALPDCDLLEVEEHAGAYAALNLHVAHALPVDLLRSRPPDARSLRVLAGRGFDPARVPALYEEFLDTAEHNVVLEVIVSSFGNLLESEVGVSMHEDRVLAQRSQADYGSALARNVRYILDYMLALCLAPGNSPVGDVPIKLWAKYMPDRVEDLIRRAFEVPSDSSFDSDLTPDGVPFPPG